jgi:hypothetical protein
VSYGDYRRPVGDDVPLVGRPRGAAWRTLQADGVVWEGQVFLVGGEADLASRMIVTHRRVAFARGGAIVLDLARDWLRPAPILRRDGTILLSITAPGSGYGVEPETIALRMRDGHPAAGHVIAMLAGSGARRITPEAVPSSDYVRGLLPPLPEARRLQSMPQTDAEPILPEFPLLAAGLDDDVPFGSLEFPAPKPAAGPFPTMSASEAPMDRDPVVRQASPPVSMTRDRSWNLEPVRQMVPRATRRRRRAWILRLGGLVLLLGFSAMLGADRIPLPRLERPISEMPTATAIPPSVARYILPTAAAGVPATVNAASTSIALGLGSEGQTAPDQASGAAPAAQATAEPTALPGQLAPTNAPAEPTPTQPAAAPPATAEPAAGAATAEPAAATAEPAATAAGAAATATAGPLQPTIDVARRGGTLPEYGLTAPQEGEWVVVMVTVTNNGADEAELTMTDFTLEADGAPIALDGRSTVVASILRLDGAPDEVDSPISLDPGESVTLPLVFRVPADAATFALRFGDTSTDVAPFFTTANRNRNRTLSLGFTSERPAIISGRLRLADPGPPASPIRNPAGLGFTHPD